MISLSFILVTKQKVNKTTLNRQRLYHLTKKILNANSLHFILISILFLPFTFSAFTAFQFYFSSPGTDVTTEHDPFNLLLIKTIVASYQNLLTVTTVTTILAFCCFVILPTIAGIALITYSTNQAIHHKPVTFSSVKSLSHSYIPLLHTFMAGSIKLVINFPLFTLAPIAVTEAIKALEFHFSLLFFSIFINSIVSYALAITILFFIVIWGSAAAITVLESKSGSETLQQSANQSTKFRYHLLYIVFITGCGTGTWMLYSSILQNSVPAGNWILTVQVGATCLQSSLLILLYVVANTVLYVQCNVASAEDIAKTLVEGKLSDVYVRLVVDDKDGEVVHELAKETNGGFSFNLSLKTIIWCNFMMCAIL